jgi:uncharacterized protein YdeI (YjbR/CyaY-like superfamily)
MIISKTLDAKNRKEWRAWLRKNHAKEKEIWLVYYRKSSNKKRIPYNDAVEEALCYGWIDSTAKNIDNERYAQRFTQRRDGSGVSEMNKARIRKLMKQGKMTAFGLAKVSHHMAKKFIIPAWVLRELKKDKEVWANFQNFPDSYKHIRIGYVVNTRASDRKRRLKYFIKMTKKNKRFGMVQY